MQGEFRVHARREAGAVVVVASGELDLASSPQLETELREALGAGEPVVIVDLRELDFMDSTGLSVLVRAHQAAVESRRRLCVVKGSQQVQRLLALTGVADRLTLVDTPEEALDGS